MITITDIKRYEPLWDSWYIEDLIGEGSFGKVYRIRQQEFGATYYSAVKIISIPQDNTEIQRMKLEGLDDASIRSFFYQHAQNIVSEINLMREFRGNSNIVSYEDHKIIENLDFSMPLESRTSNLDPSLWDILIRMELLKSLPSLAAEKPLPTAEILKLGIHICRALELCARKNIIHRDIKPENIFISPHGEYKLGDFGVARHLEHTMSGLSRKGTYMTMAPEVFKGEKYSASVDTYSLGIVIYTLLNQNRAPFLPAHPQPIMPQDRENALQKRMNGDPLPELQTEGYQLGISPELNAFLHKACAYDRENRYAHPTDMRKTLEAIGAGNGCEPESGPLSGPEPLSLDSTDITPTPAPGSDGQTLHLLSPETNQSVYDCAETTGYNASTQSDPSTWPELVNNAHPAAPAHPPDLPTKPHPVPVKPSKGKRRLPIAIAIAAIILTLAGATILIFYLAAKVQDPTNHGISINGQVTFILASKEDAQSVLDNLAAYYIQLINADANATTVTYEEKVEIVKTDPEMHRQDNQMHQDDPLRQDSPPQTILIMNTQDALQALIEGKTQTENGETTTQPYLHVILEWIGEVTEDIDYKTETKKDDTVILHTTEIQQEGEKGTKLISYKYIARNSVIIENTLLEERIAKEPVDEIILEGTKPIEIVLDNQNITSSDLTAMVQNGKIPRDVTTLSLKGNQIADLSPLRSLTGLTILHIDDNNISSLEPLQSMTELTTLTAGNNNISDLTPLKTLTKLSDLYLTYNKITNLAPLQPLKELTILHVHDQKNSYKISDITPLASLTNLTILGLYHNNISDLTPLASLTKLTVLSLADNNISDLSALRSLKNLQTLYLFYNQISDFSALNELKGLKMVSIWGNPNADLPKAASDLRSALGATVTLYMKNLRDGNRQNPSTNNLSSTNLYHPLPLPKKRIPRKPSPQNLRNSLIGRAIT
ncbi:MAG: leucine-rich repeat domain-containing protein [Peptococcaceae bacterium]|nr:leucine-rich repeat domain-containing protein [Peptococcaceae bacterium]